MYFPLWRLICGRKEIEEEYIRVIHSSTRQRVHVCIVRAKSVFLLTVETAMLLHDKESSSSLSESRCSQQFRGSSADFGFSVLTEDDCSSGGVLRCILALSAAGSLSPKLMRLLERTGNGPPPRRSLFVPFEAEGFKHCERLFVQKS